MLNSKFTILDWHYGWKRGDRKPTRFATGRKLMSSWVKRRLVNGHPWETFRNIDPEWVKSFTLEEQTDISRTENFGRPWAVKMTSASHITPSIRSDCWMEYTPVHIRPQAHPHPMDYLIVVRGQLNFIPWIVRMSASMVPGFTLMGRRL